MTGSRRRPPGELADGPFVVIGPSPVFDTLPGQIIDRPLTVGEARALIAGGTIAPAGASSTRPNRPQGATAPRRRKKQVRRL